MFDTPCVSTPRRSVMVKTSAASAASSDVTPSFSKICVTVRRSAASATNTWSFSGTLNRSRIMARSLAGIGRWRRGRLDSSQRLPAVSRETRGAAVVVDIAAHPTPNPDWPPRRRLPRDMRRAMVVARDPARRGMKGARAMWEALWRNGKVATLTEGRPFGLIDRGAVAAEGGRIAWVGQESALPAEASSARVVHDLGGRLLTPGLVDPHNHAVYYGDALADFELLTQGGTRADMIASGGGVGGLVRQTRAATDAQITAASTARMEKLIAAGITTMESKSGAGLDLETELRCLRISRALGRALPATVITTFLGAHGIAPEYRGRPDDYVDHLCTVVLP